MYKENQRKKTDVMSSCAVSIINDTNVDKFLDALEEIWTQNLPIRDVEWVFDH